MGREMICRLVSVCRLVSMCRLVSVVNKHALLGVMTYFYISTEVGRDGV